MGRSDQFNNDMVIKTRRPCFNTKNVNKIFYNKIGNGFGANIFLYFGKIYGQVVNGN